MPNSTEIHSIFANQDQVYYYYNLIKSDYSGKKVLISIGLSILLQTPSKALLQDLQHQYCSVVDHL